LQTVLIRYKNRDFITADELRMESLRSRGMVNSSAPESDAAMREKKNYHQLDRLVIQVDETTLLQPSAEIMSRLLQRRHYDVIDYEIEIPELLLKQQQRTNDIWAR
jgi:putative ABC transport system permease protein